MHPLCTLGGCAKFHGRTYPGSGCIITHRAPRTKAPCYSTWGKGHDGATRPEKTAEGLGTAGGQPRQSALSPRGPGGRAGYRNRSQKGPAVPGTLGSRAFHNTLLCQTVEPWQICCMQSNTATGASRFVFIRRKERRCRPQNGPCRAIPISQGTLSHKTNQGLSSEVLPCLERVRFSGAQKQAQFSLEKCQP